MIYKYSDYISFLIWKVGSKGTRTGQKNLLAQAMGCQQTYLSKVFNREAHISLEQAMGACNYLKLSPKETEYFLCIVNLARAGTKDLKAHYKKMKDQLQIEMLAVEKQIDIKEHLQPLDQSIYYSHWSFAAVHVAVSLRICRDIESIGNTLDLSREQVATTTDFLLKAGLIRFSNGHFSPGPTHIHLKKHSPDAIKNHTNWRLKALESVSNNINENFHYTVVASLSESDAINLKMKMIEWVEAFLKQIETSNEEVIYCHNIDFFKINK